MPNPYSPLDATHLSQINNALERIAAAEAQIILAKQARIDVTEMERNLAQSKEKLVLLRNVYFPNGV